MVPTYSNTLEPTRTPTITIPTTPTISVTPRPSPTPTTYTLKEVSFTGNIEYTVRDFWKFGSVFMNILSLKYEDGYGWRFLDNNGNEYTITKSVNDYEGTHFDMIYEAGDSNMEIVNHITVPQYVLLIMFFRCGHDTIRPTGEQFIYIPSLNSFVTHDCGSNTRCHNSLYMFTTRIDNEGYVNISFYAITPECNSITLKENAKYEAYTLPNGKTYVLESCDATYTEVVTEEK